MHENRMDNFVDTSKVNDAQPGVHELSETVKLSYILYQVGYVLCLFPSFNLIFEKSLS